MNTNVPVVDETKVPGVEPTVNASVEPVAPVANAAEVPVVPPTNSVEDLAAMLGSAFETESVETTDQRTARIIAEISNETWANGFKPNKLIKGVQCTSKVTVTKMNGYDNVTININQVIPTFDANGKVIQIRTVTNSLISVCGALHQAGYGAITEYLMNNPQAISLLLVDCKFDVLTQFVKANDVYRNPFSTNENNGTTALANRINHYLVHLTLGERGLAAYEKIIDKILLG